MKCSRARRWILAEDVSNLPEEIRRHTAQCPACGRVLERTRWSCELIGLKRYEHPSAGAEGRCVAAVRRRLRAGREMDVPGRAMPLFPRATPGFVYAAAVASLAAVSALVAGTSRVPTLSSTLSPESIRLSEVEQVLSMTNESAFGMGVPLSEFSEFSNRPPPRIERSNPRVHYVIGPPR